MTPILQKQFKRVERQRDELGKALHLIIEHCQDADAQSLLLLQIETIAKTALEVTGQSQRGKPSDIKLRAAP